MFKRRPKVQPSKYQMLVNMIDQNDSLPVVLATASAVVLGVTLLLWALRLRKRNSQKSIYVLPEGPPTTFHQEYEQANSQDYTLQPASQASTTQAAYSSVAQASAYPPVAPTPAPRVAPAPTPPPPLAYPRTVDGGYFSATMAPNPEGGASYLVYDSGSSGRLVEHYSRTPIEHALGRWTPGGGKQLSGFKFQQNLGRTVLMGSCAAGVQGRKNYSIGWCQFVRSARVSQGEVMLWDPVAKGLKVDVYVYNNDSRRTHQTIKLKPGVAVKVTKSMAVACVPKGSPFYEGTTIDLLTWLSDGTKYGASSKF